MEDRVVSTQRGGEADCLRVKPQFEFQPLTASVKKIDEASRTLLQRVGVRIDEPSVLDRLQHLGAVVDHEEGRVRFDPQWLDKYLSTAPRQFVLHSRDGAHDIRLGTGHVSFSNGGRVFRILDMATGGYRSTVLRDVAHTAALVQNLEYVDLYIIACQAHDIEAEFYHANDFFHALSHTTKHVMGGCGDVEGVRQVWSLAGLIAGGEQHFRAQPFLSVITNPVSPLTIDAGTLKIMDFCCTKGIPLTCAPAPIAGATGPATLAGTLVQMHAEALAGVALTQVFEPGAKVLYGAVPTAMDLRTMEFTMGSVEVALMSGFSVHLAKLYDLPIYASAGVTEAKRPDIQSGVEKSFSILSTALAGADFVHLAAGMLDSGNSISYEQYVIDNEIIGMTRRLLDGFTLDNDALALSVIESVGPGGNYVIQDHTVNHMMDEFYYPELAVRSNFDIWEGRGRPNMLTRAGERVDRILSESAESLLDQALIERIMQEFPQIENAK